MSHARQQIRQRVADLLAAADHLEGRVFVNPHNNFADDQLPAVVVTTPQETIDSLMGGRKEHSLIVAVEIIAMSNEVADDLDQLASEIEVALASDSLGDLVTDWRHISTAIQFDKGRAQVAGSAKLGFSCLYDSLLADPDTII